MPTYTSTSGFTRELSKKIDKTKEARNGEGIYKRRNRRTYRVVMHLTTYLKLLNTNPNRLNLYADGYAVRLRPDEYFDENGHRNKKLPTSIELGKNAFIYFKSIGSWKTYYKFCKNFKEVVELTTTPNQNNLFDSWIGEYCNYIKNTQPQKVSLICTTDYDGKKKEVKNLLKELIDNKTTLFEKDGNNNFSIPAQAGLGNYDYDYASADEIEHVRYQMAYLIYKVPGMKKELEEQTGFSSDKIDACENHVINYCKKNNLLNFQVLASINAWDLHKNVPICPLCKSEITAKEFFTTIDQDEGREEEDNTQSSIELMHIEPLRAGEFNHRTYNLGWGHKHCNIIQGPSSISETLEKLKRILQNNGM